MPLQFKVSINGDTFEMGGDVDLNAASALFRQWLNAKDETPGKLEDLAQRLETQTASLEAAIGANTPKET